MTTTQPAAGPPAQLKETERVQAPIGGPGRGPFGGGMVGQKASTFAPSAKRLIGRMAPDRFKAGGRGRCSRSSAWASPRSVRRSWAAPPT